MGDLAIVVNVGESTFEPRFPLSPNIRVYQHACSPQSSPCNSYVTTWQNLIKYHDMSLSNGVNFLYFHDLYV